MTVAPTAVGGRTDDVGSALDRLRAVRTVPRRRRRRHHDLSACADPAVDRRLWEQHVRLARCGDAEARNALLAAYEDHARALARRYHRDREHLDDLVQVAIEALLRALDRFDPERRTPFLGFAGPTIAGALKRHYRDAGWALRVPRSVHELVGPVRDAADLLGQDLGRRPSYGEIADLVGASPAAVEGAMVASTARATSSLDAPIGGDDGDDGDGGDGTSLAASLGDHDPALRLVEDRAALHQALAVLDDDQRLLLDRYFGRRMAQHDIAALLGVSQVQVSRLLARALRRLRGTLAS